MVDSHALTPDQCLRLMRTEVAGRVAVSTADGPHIISVNYCVVDDSIVIRTTPDSLLGTHGRNTRLSFQIDAFDRARERGWSVQARGQSEVVTDRHEIMHILDVAGARAPWASGIRTLYLRLRWDELSGRQLGRLWDPVELLGAPGEHTDATGPPISLLPHDEATPSGRFYATRSHEHGPP